MRCGTTSAVLAAVLACFAYAFLVRSQQHQLEGERGAGYELGSGKMFDSIAPRYDLINKVISLGLDMQWRRAMVQGLKLRAGDRVVDMATGTADVAIMISGELAELEEAVGDRGTGNVYSEVVGIDPSANMLQVGREKAAEASLSSRVRLEIGDAQDLSNIADGSVDKLTMAFGIRNVLDRLKALREIRRIMATPSSEKELATTEPGSTQEGVTGDGGSAAEEADLAEHSSSVVAIMELQDPETGLLATASRAFIKYGAPVLGWLISGNGAEYGHLKNSILSFPTVSEWTALMEEAGLEVVSHETMGFGTVHLYLARPRIGIAR